jgi:ferric-dicitrate binding protein FerR (iron transport regulator)
MNENANTEIDLLAAKYLAGEATAEEAMVMEEWLAIPANRERFEEMVRLWNILPGNTTYKPVDVNHEWKQFPVNRSSAKIRFFFKRRSIAAAVIFLITCSLIMYLSKLETNSPTSQEYVVRNSVHGIFIDTLPDASIVTLNSNSSIRYSHHFNQKDRNLELIGESYFNVTASKEKPFIIATEGIHIKVVGTSFNVKRTLQPEKVEVQVASGVVKMYDDRNEITVVKGQTGTYVKSSKRFQLVDTVDANSIGYATRVFSFNNMSLDEISKYLESSYSISIKGDSSLLSSCRLTARFENESLDYILDVIAATLNIKYRVEGKTIFLIGKGCI